MNIIEIALDDCRTLMRKSTFEINSVLTNPTEQGSLERLSKAIYDYSTHESAFNNLMKLKSQFEHSNEAAEEVNEN